MTTALIDQVLADIAASKATNREASTALIDPALLRKHLWLALALAGASFFVVVALAAATRLAPMTDKQVALSAVVALTAAGLFIIALLSAGASAASAYARQRLALQESFQVEERLRLEQRQARLDAIEEACKNQEASFAMQVTADLMWAELKSKPTPDREVLEELHRFMELHNRCYGGVAEQQVDRVAFSEVGLRIFHRYETVLGSLPQQRNLTQQPMFQRMKETFRGLDFA